MHTVFTRLVLASALAAGAVFTASGPAAAGGCEEWWQPCGEVQNDTPWGMHVTTTLGAGPHGCDVWNSLGGVWSDWRWFPCTQEYLTPGGHRGGGNVDADAFTFNDRGYWVIFASWGWGQPKWLNAGVWTKIVDTQTAVCEAVNGVPKCFVD